jgi:hypothetical protein
VLVTVYRFFNAKKKNCLPRYNWNIIESGIKHHKPNQFNPKLIINIYREHSKKYLKDQCVKTSEESVKYNLSYCDKKHCVYRRKTMASPDTMKWIKDIHYVFSNSSQYYSLYI